MDAVRYMKDRMASTRALCTRFYLHFRRQATNGGPSKGQQGSGSVRLMNASQVQTRSEVQNQPLAIGSAPCCAFANEHLELQVTSCCWCPTAGRRKGSQGGAGSRPMGLTVV